VTELKGCLTTEMYHIHLCDKDPDMDALQSNQPLHRWRSHYVGRRFILLHQGVDVEEMKESAIKDMNEGRFARGGSTITQQAREKCFLSASKNPIRKN